MEGKPSFLNFSQDRTIVPKMQNKLGDSYAETKSELEMRKKAEEEARIQQAVERQVQAIRHELETEYKKKRAALLSFGVIMSILTVLGFAAAIYFFLLLQNH